MFRSLKYLILIIFPFFVFSINKKNPSFVGNAIAYINSESEGETTDSKGNFKYKFKKKDFEDPPFATVWMDCKKKQTTSRGKIVNGFLYRRNDKIIGSNDLKSIADNSNDCVDIGILEKNSKSKIIAPYLSILEKTSFLTQTEVDEKLQNIKYVIGLNRPRSLSSRKNRLVSMELLSSYKSLIDIDVFGFYWDYPWVEFTRLCDGSLVKFDKKFREKVPYEKVLSFYKQLRSRDKTKAKLFRKKNEKGFGLRSRMIPYRELRDVLKGSEFTKSKVGSIRKIDPNATVYLFVTDIDTVDFNGVFSSYFEIAKKEKPDVMTSGYLFESNNPMVLFASALDMRVRFVTSKYIPTGPYFPEPSLCILVLNNKDTVEESFLERTNKGNISKANYGMPGESKKILKDINKNRTKTKILFINGQVLKTRAPDRSYKDKLGNKLKFKAEFNEETKKFINWSFVDLNNLTINATQSHANSYSWSKNLIDTLKCNDRYKGLSLSLIYQISISLLSRLFNSYNPIFLADNNKSKLFSILNNYEKNVKQDKIKKYSPKGRSNDVWYDIDAIESREKLLNILSEIINNVKIEDIDSAAYSSGKEISNFIKKYFKFNKEFEFQEDDLINDISSIKIKEQ